MRPFPRYTVAVMASFIAFELWVPVLAIILRALAGPTVPTAVQVVASLLGLAVPTVVGLALSDYLADRPGLVKPYQPKRRPGSGPGGEGPAGAGGEGPGGEGPAGAGGEGADGDGDGGEGAGEEDQPRGT